MKAIMKNDDIRIGKKAKRKKYEKGHWQLTVLELPSLIWLFVFGYIPMVGLIVAFKDYKFSQGIFGSEWIGLENFAYLFKSNSFSILIRNTLGYNLAFIACNVVFGVFTALMLDMINSKKMIKGIQTCLFIPYFISWIVVSYITHAFLEYDSGMINSVIEKFGETKISFYTDGKYWPLIMVIANVWKSIGFQMLVYYGTILSIDTSLYEAAAIDGCTYIKRIWHITIPHLMPTICTLTLLAIGSAFRSDFGMFYYLPKQSGALMSATDVLDTYILRSVSSAGDIGGASAVGLIQSVVGLILVVASNAVVKRVSEENSMF